MTKKLEDVVETKKDNTENLTEIEKIETMEEEPKEENMKKNPTDKKEAERKPEDKEEKEKGHEAEEGKETAKKGKKKLIIIAVIIIAIIAAIGLITTHNGGKKDVNDTGNGAKNIETEAPIVSAELTDVIRTINLPKGYTYQCSGAHESLFKEGNTDMKKPTITIDLDMYKKEKDVSIEDSAKNFKTLKKEEAKGWTEKNEKSSKIYGAKVWSDDEAHTILQKGNAVIRVELLDKKEKKAFESVCEDIKIKGTKKD